MANTVTKDGLVSYVMDKIQEFDLNIQEFDNVTIILADLDLMEIFRDCGGDWRTFDTFVEKNIIGKALMDDANDSDEDDDFEGYSEEEHSDFPDDDDDVYEEEPEEEKIKRQAEYEEESRKNRESRLACKTPEELYNFKVKMGWLPNLTGSPEAMKRELDRCAQEIAMRARMEESFGDADKGPYHMRPFFPTPHAKEASRQ